MTYPNEYSDKCNICHKELIYDIIEGKYEFCSCLENKQNIKLAKDQVSLADIFENEIQIVISRYCGQGLTIGTAIGALQNRMFELNLNLHMPVILEVLKGKLK